MHKVKSKITSCARLFSCVNQLRCVYFTLIKISMEVIARLYWLACLV